MDWHEIAIELSRLGFNSGDITRELQNRGFFSGEDYYHCYERVRKYVRKQVKKSNITQNTVPALFKQDTKERVITFGLIGDTHIGSNYDDISLIEKFYTICKDYGVTEVYHCGDITDGDKMRVGHEYEIYAHGADAIIKNVVDNYPKIDGINTYFITGNHDASLYKNCGVDIGKYIADARSDMIYLGRDCSIVDIHGITLEMRHPWDGSSYAISQKTQKIIDNMYEFKPDILAVGHYHKAEFIQYKGVYAFQVGCIQHRTPFEVGKNIIPVLGGWIISLTIDNCGNIQDITPKFISFN